jgi:hypothetical protein
LMPEEFPAVTRPSFLKAGASLARASAEVARGNSSTLNSTVSFLTLMGTGMISSLRRPVRQSLFAALSCEDKQRRQAPRG